MIRGSSLGKLTNQEARQGLRLHISRLDPYRVLIGMAGMEQFYNRKFSADIVIIDSRFPPFVHLLGLKFLVSCLKLCSLHPQRTNDGHSDWIARQIPFFQLLNLYRCTLSLNQIDISCLPKLLIALAAILELLHHPPIS